MFYPALCQISDTDDIKPGLADQFYLADCRYAGESFSAKAQTAHGDKVHGIFYLARGVPFESILYIVPVYPASVVCDPDHIDSASGYLDCYSRGMGIYGVLHKLFDNGGRSFYNFTGSDRVYRR